MMVKNLREINQVYTLLSNSPNFIVSSAIDQTRSMD